MSLDIREEVLTPAALDEHATIRIAFVVDRILDLTLVDGAPWAECCSRRPPSQIPTSMTMTPAERDRRAGMSALR